MSIITAIFQAILQAITYIIPISESGHSSIFHDFAGRADGTVSSLTGAVHIGIAIGIFLASFNIFLKLGKEFFSTGYDIVKKQLDIKVIGNMRKLMLMTLVSFIPMLLWLIPIGKYGSLYTVLKATSYNNTLFDDGVFLALLGGLLFAAARQLTLNKNNEFVTLPMAVTAGVCSLFFVPVSGFALIGGVFSVLVLFGVKRNLAIKYAFVMSVPVLLVSGIVQLCTADYNSGIVPVIIGIVLSCACAFLLTRVLKNIIKKDYLKYISYYDVSLGAIVAVIGIIQLIVRK